jgi:hypothetical protein
VRAVRGAPTVPAPGRQAPLGPLVGGVPSSAGARPLAARLRAEAAGGRLAPPVVHGVARRAIAAQRRLGAVRKSVRVGMKAAAPLDAGRWGVAPGAGETTGLARPVLATVAATAAARAVAEGPASAGGRTPVRSVLVDARATSGVAAPGLEAPRGPARLAGRTVVVAGVTGDSVLLGMEGAAQVLADPPSVGGTGVPPGSVKAALVGLPVRAASVGLRVRAGSVGLATARGDRVASGRVATALLRLAVLAVGFGAGRVPAGQGRRVVFGAVREPAAGRGVLRPVASGGVAPDLAPPQAAASAGVAPADPPAPSGAGTTGVGGATATTGQVVVPVLMGMAVGRSAIEVIGSGGAMGRDAGSGATGRAVVTDVRVAPPMPATAAAAGVPRAAVGVGRVPRAVPVAAPGAATAEVTAVLAAMIVVVARVETIGSGARAEGTEGMVGANAGAKGARGGRGRRAPARLPLGPMLGCAAPGTVVRSRAPIPPGAASLVAGLAKLDVRRKRRRRPGGQRPTEPVTVVRSRGGRPR